VVDIVIDEHDGDAAFLGGAHEAKHDLRFLDAERRCRFVENQHLGPKPAKPSRPEVTIPRAKSVSLRR
jgi:hypothetical protein